MTSLSRHLPAALAATVLLLSGRADAQLSSPVSAVQSQQTTVANPNSAAAGQIAIPRA